MTDLPKHPVLDRLKQIPVDMRAYVEKRLELVALETGEKIANIFAKTASTVATTLIALMALLFFLLAAGFFLGDLLDSYAMGFGVVALFLAVFALVVYLLAPEAIEDKVRERIAREFLNDNRSDSSGAGDSGVNKAGVDDSGDETGVSGAAGPNGAAVMTDPTVSAPARHNDDTVLVESPIAPTKSKTS